MPALSTAREDYKCTTCKLWIRKGMKYCNKPRYQFGVDKYCTDCIRKELDKK